MTGLSGIEQVAPGMTALALRAVDRDRRAMEILMSLEGATCVETGQPTRRQ
jgi:hypothetical protein